MRKTKLWLMTLATLLGSLTASAYDFEVGDICYYITSNADLTVEVMYCDYSGIRVISIPSTVVYNDKTYCVTSIGDNAFQGCSKLSSVDIPESVTSIGNSAFSGCSSLTSITIPESSVTSIGRNAFYSTAWYNKQPDGVIYINKILYKYKGTMPENTSIKVKEGTVCISSSAFEGCSGLISITIPGSVTSIGRNAFNRTAWYNNQPDGVIYIGKVLYQYKGSMPANTSIEVKEGTVSISPSAFYDCNSLTSITIPKSVTSIDFGHGYSSATTFYACNLTSISVAEGNPCYDSRNNCNAIIESKSNTLVLGCRTTIIPEGITAIEDHAFDGFLRGGSHSIVIPEGVTSIGVGAFANCSRLTSITLPESMTSIENSAFHDCRNLTSITLPEGMTSIGAHAFSQCRSLTSITCHAATPPTCDSGSFSDVNTSIPVYVPAVSVADYQAAEVWKEFTNFVGMETGIADVIVGEDADAPIYNMNGMRIRNTLEHLPAGIYIQNGKKFMVM